MATIKYQLQSKSDNAPIYLRLSLSQNKYVKRKTGLNTSFSTWSVKTGLPKQNSAVNKNLTTILRGLQTFLLDEVNTSSAKGIEVNGDWLTAKIDAHFNRTKATNLDHLINYGEYFIKNLRFKVTDKGKNGVSVSTQKKYRTIVNKLKAFEDYRGKTILVKDVNLMLRNELVQYFDEVDNLNENTIGRYLKFVKSICLDAQRNGIATHNQLEHFKGFTVKVPKVILTPEELEILKNKDFVNDNHNIARDWLIIGCYTGQRVSDLLRMKSNLVQNIHNFNFIVLEQIKTEKIVQIPIHKEVRDILDKRNGEFPPLFTKNIDSNKAMFNKYLKQLCQIAEINTVVEGNKFDEETKRTVRGKFKKYELVSSHICRRSFATNFYSNSKYPTPLLMNITAHSTEKMFLEYIGKKPIDYSLQLAKIWANDALKKSDKDKPQLEVVKAVSNN